MKELFEFRINFDFAYLLFNENERKNLGTSVRIIQLQKTDPRFSQIPIVDKEIKSKYNKAFYFSWSINRIYSEEELSKAKLFKIIIQNIFEPCGEECGTEYDEGVACDICGANRKQLGLLKLKKGSIPKKDIAQTIAGEVVFSEKFVTAFNQYGFKGVNFDKVYHGKHLSNYYQLIITSPELNLSNKTIAGVDPFDFSEAGDSTEINVLGKKMRLGKEIYKCPDGHTIGLNLLSEVHVVNSPDMKNYDILVSREKIGVTRGYLRPEPLYLCSPKFREMVLDEKLKGFDFEVVYIDWSAIQNYYIF